MASISNILSFLIGKPLKAHPTTKQHLTLVAFLAWVGLGADAISSSCYGPEQSFLALGVHHHLAFYVSGITVITIFIISAGYNQVIELFPGGGGGYLVATKLLHPYAGLVSGAALIVDYVLTIAVSIASGADALFSFLPPDFLQYKLLASTLLVVCFLVLNMRGMKETIQILLPIFIGFMVLHVALIVYGIAINSKGLTNIIPDTVKDTTDLASTVGWFAVIGLVLHAYSLGSGTYTGLESVSNNVGHLSEPRVETGKRTMWYMAFSLSIIAGGIILLYLLWQVEPVSGKTLNAVVFNEILGNSVIGQGLLIVTLMLEAGLLLIAANTGFAAGPNVLANMAVDGWIPNRFRHLSNRLVVQNGLILYGVAALGILIWTSGDVGVLVVLYSINVFITFSLSLLSICVYWIKHRASRNWRLHFLLSAVACFITTGILVITVYFKFMAGGWLTLLITSTIIILCIAIKRHYQFVAKTLTELDKQLYQPLGEQSAPTYAINPQLQTAVIFVSTFSEGMHTFLSVLRFFPGLFKNFVFLSAGIVDVESFKGEHEFAVMQHLVEERLGYFVNYCHQLGLPAEGYTAFGTDTVEELKGLTDKVCEKYSNTIFFACQLVFKNENLLTRFLHNQTPLIIQHFLHFKGRELMILPMRI